MKKVLFTLLAIIMIMGTTACGAASDPEGEHPSPRVAVLPGPSAFGALWLMDGDTVLDYQIEIHGTPDAIPPLLVQGAIDIAAVPTNLASILFNGNVDITVLAVTTMGVLHIVDTTGEIGAISDLAGRTIHLSGLGAAPEFALNYVLRRNGLEPGVDVELVFHGDMPLIAAQLAQCIADIALLPEPFATTVIMQNEHVRHALDLTEEWHRVSPDFGLVMTAVIVRNDFLENYPDTVNIFMEELEQSINFINNNLEEAADLAVYHEILLNRAIALAAIPRTNQVFLTGRTMQRYLSGYLAVLYGENPASVGGALPDEAFYFIP